VVASTGSACGIVYLQGGGLKEVCAAIQNMAGNITGMVCDGAKVGCAMKVASGVSCAIQSAVLALRGTCIGPTDGIGQPFVSATPTLQATGGFGTIQVQVTKPQHVTVADLSGKVIFHDWLESTSIIPAHKGIYIVNHQKVLVR
jgi:L-cysteine desulfidase